MNTSLQVKPFILADLAKQKLESIESIREFWYKAYIDRRDSEVPRLRKKFFYRFFCSDWSDDKIFRDWFSKNEKSRACSNMLTSKGLYWTEFFACKRLLYVARFAEQNESKFVTVTAEDILNLKIDEDNG